MALIRRLTSKAVAVEATKMPEYKLKNPPSEAEDANQKTRPRRRPRKRKARRKREKAAKKAKSELTVACVEVGGLLKACCEYREEQAHRRAAIRLMFQTAMNPGTKDEDEDEDEPTTVAAVDMQQFSAMVESLHSKVTPGMVASLYPTYELEKKKCHLIVL